MPEKLSPWARLGLFFIYLVVMTLLVTGVVILWDYLRLEHGRTEPWKALLYLFADLSALIWFHSFFLRHVVRGKSFVAIPWDEFQLSQRWYLLGSPILALAIDAWATYTVRSEDQERFAVAVMGQGVTDRVVTDHSDYRRVWELHGHLLHPDGREYPFRFRLFAQLALERWRFVERVPANVQQSLLLEQQKFAVPLLYDSDWPARNWLMGRPWQEENRSWYLSYLFLIAQAPGFVLLLAFIVDGYQKGVIRASWE